MTAYKGFHKDLACKSLRHTAWKKKTMRRIINTAVGVICAISLTLVCSEPAEGTSLNRWMLCEVINLAVFALCARYLDRHLPDDEKKDAGTQSRLSENGGEC